jgi:hypothetical protein
MMHDMTGTRMAWGMSLGWLLLILLGPAIATLLKCRFSR